MGFDQVKAGKDVPNDINDAGLCVQEMQKRGEWEYFVGDTEDKLIYTRYHKVKKLAEEAKKIAIDVSTRSHAAQKHRRAANL